MSNYHVSIDGNAAIVGALHKDFSGSAYVFKQTDTGWKQVAKQTGTDEESKDYFGESVSISGATFIVGACEDDVNGENSGSAYIFTSGPTIDLQATSDTGYSTTDNITSKTMPTFDIVDAPYYRVYRDGIQVSGDCETASSYTSAALPDGTYEFMIRTVNQAGNELLTSMALNVTIDTVAPNIPGVVPDLRADSDLGLSNADNITCDNTPSFDVPDTPYYRFYLNGTEVSCQYQGGIFTLPEQPDGTYDVSAIATDAAGNESATRGESLSITIDTVAPSPLAVAADLQAGSDTGLYDGDNVTNDTTPTFDVTVTGYYRLYRGNVLVCDYETGSSVTLPPQPDGNHQFTLVTVDEAGNESTPSPACYVTINTNVPWQTDLTTTKLLASDGQADDFFGHSVSVSDTTAIVGAYRNDSNGSGAGSAYIIEQTDTGWQQVAELMASDGEEGDGFGINVSISGTTAIVGAYQDDDNGWSSGAAYIFEQTDAGWQQVAKLTAADGEKYDRFGYRVSISGSVAIVGAQYDDDNGEDSGSAYIFEQTNNGWEQTAKLTADDGASEDYFGNSVSISGTTAIVGAFKNDSNGTDSGAAYIFERTDSGWQQVVKLTARDGATEDWFGCSVSISGSSALVGAIFDDDRGIDSGSVYAFERTDTGWQHVGKLKAADGASGDLFGSSVCISGDMLIVGANSNDDRGSNSGSAYIFKKSYTNWYQTKKLLAPGGASEDYFGSSVSISDNACIVGACQNDDNGINAGSAYVFTGKPIINLLADSDTGPSSTDNITNDNTPTFEVAVHSYAPYYRIYRDGVLVSGDYESAASFVSEALPDGTYEFSVRAVDQAGNETITDFTQIITIDTMVPSVSGVLPDLKKESDLGLSDSDNLTCDNTPTFDISNTAYYRFFLDGTEVSTGYQCGSFTLPKQPDGTYSITVLAVDAAGNESALSDPLIINIDTVALQASPNAPDLQAASDWGMSNTDNITFDTTPTFYIVTTPHYRVYRDGIQISGDYESGSSYTSAELAAGTYEFTVCAVDAAGNVTQQSSPLTVTIEASSRILGDANEDGKVDRFDGRILASNWQAGVNDGQTVTWNMGDFSRDGKVDSLDLSIFIDSWQASIDAAGAGEEPGQTAIQFVPPANASLGIATVPRHESLPPRRPIIPLLTTSTATTNVASIDAVLAESVLAESDYTAIAKDLSAVSAKKSTVTSDRSFALGFDPYADLG